MSDSELPGLPASERSLVVQSDGTLQLDVVRQGAGAARDALAAFADLEKSPNVTVVLGLRPVTAKAD